MPAPLAYFISWTTYGTWLPGDERGWVAEGKSGIQAPNPVRYELAQAAMTGDPVILTPPQRALVKATIEKHCDIRHWFLHAVNPRTNHVHVIVTAPLHPKKVMEQFKAWSTRHLNEEFGRRKDWWTEDGSKQWINDEKHLRNAIRYVLELQ
jgi:REP element-mobilizing transposase RayT